MKTNKPFLLLILLLCAGCLPPWAGEECNYPVVQFNYYGPNWPDRNDYVSLEELGVRRITHLERSSNIRVTGWEEEPNMTFARYDRTRDILLPLDVEAEEATFVMERDARNDTLILTYKSSLDMVDGCGYTFVITELKGRINGFDWGDLYEGQHPRVVGEAGVFP